MFVRNSDANALAAPQAADLRDERRRRVAAAVRHHVRV